MAVLDPLESCDTTSRVQGGQDVAVAVRRGSSRERRYVVTCRDTPVEKASVPMNQQPFEQMPFQTLPEEPRRAHLYSRTREEFIKLDSPHFGRMQVSTRRWGKGPPLVCVHGLMTTSYSFRYLLEPLADSFELFLFDLPGAGRSDKPDVQYGAFEMADAIGDVMQAAGLEGAPVLGNSMGGYLCMWLAMRRPAVMSRLVNLHSPGLPTFRVRALEGAMALVPRSEALLDWMVARDPLRWAFRNVHYWDESLKSLEEAREYAAPLSTPDGRRAFSRHLSDTMCASTMRTFERELQDRCAQGRPFPVPLQLVYAKRDPMVPPVVGVKLAKLVPSAKIAWLDEASHFAHVDATDRFLATMIPFLRGK